MAETSLHLRPAVPADAHAIASINVGCWQEAYAHILDPAILAQRSVDDAAVRWRGYLSRGDGDLTVFVAEDAGCVLGFGSCSGQRDEELRGDGYSGEITALYVLMSEQRRGIGNQLLRALASTLDAAGHARFSLWVLAENIHARNFYEGIGGLRLPRMRLEARLGDVPELAYGWHGLPGPATLSPHISSFSSAQKGERA